jgi:hypothetical protein
MAQPSSAPTKCKVVTGAPSYALAWMFLTPCILVPSFALFASFWVIAGMHQSTGALAKSKVVTGAPSYPLAWTFLDTMHSYASAHALCWLRSLLARAGRRVLQQKVKW